MAQRSELGGCPGGQHACIANLVDRVDAVAAAALGREHGVVENRQAAEIIVFAGLVWRSIANLRDGKFAELVDGRRKRSGSGREQAAQRRWK